MQFIVLVRHRHLNDTAPDADNYIDDVITQSLNGLSGLAHERQGNGCLCSLPRGTPPDPPRARPATWGRAPVRMLRACSCNEQQHMRTNWTGGLEPGDIAKVPGMLRGQSIYGPGCS